MKHKNNSWQTTKAGFVFANFYL